MGSLAAFKIILCSSVLLDSAETNPYAIISQRNVFGLREPPPVIIAKPIAVPTNDLPELMLTGIADFPKAKWALLTSTERGKQPRRYTLKPGDKEGDLQVVAIDAEAGTVHVLHGSRELVLTFDTHGPPTAAKVEEEGRKHVQKSKAFVDAHTQGHAMREKREAERRAVERAAAEAELAAQRISNQQ